jgi:hypothetical protein
MFRSQRNKYIANVNSEPKILKPNLAFEGYLNWIENKKMKIPP